MDEVRQAEVEALRAVVQQMRADLAEKDKLIMDAQQTIRALTYRLERMQEERKQ